MEENNNEEKELSLFDIINDISTHGNVVEEYYEKYDTLPKAYSSYMINKAFGNFKDTIFYANELNKYSLADETHWAFLSAVIKPKKRFGKWFKPDSEDTIEILSKYFDCSVKEMKKNISYLSKGEINEILEKMSRDEKNKGKVSKRKRK